MFSELQESEERRHHREHARHLVAEPEGEHPRPDDLVAQPGAAGEEEDHVQQDRPLRFHEAGSFCPARVRVLTELSAVSRGRG